MERTIVREGREYHLLKILPDRAIRHALLTSKISGVDCVIDSRAYTEKGEILPAYVAIYVPNDNDCEIKYKESFIRMINAYIHFASEAAGTNVRKICNGTLYVGAEYEVLDEETAQKIYAEYNHKEFLEKYFGLKIPDIDDIPICNQKIRNDYLTIAGEQYEFISNCGFETIDREVYVLRKADMNFVYQADAYIHAGCTYYYDGFSSYTPKEKTAFQKWEENGNLRDKIRRNIKMKYSQYILDTIGEELDIQERSLVKLLNIGDEVIWLKSYAKQIRRNFRKKDFFE